MRLNSNHPSGSRTRTVPSYVIGFVSLAVVLLSIVFAVSATEARCARAILVGRGLPQLEDGWAAIKTETGILFVWNVRGLYFTLDLKGKEIKPLDDPDHIFFTVDGRVLQIQLTAINNFAPDAREKQRDDRAILAAHRDWEAKYIEDNLLHGKLSLRTFNTKLSNGAEALMWQFDMPQAMRPEAEKQLYLTLVAKDYVLMLNSEANTTNSDGDGRKFLLDTIATLKISPTPIDVQKLSESLRPAH